jgi:PDDEXK-like domain of unknown function (DUF3799)
MISAAPVAGVSETGVYDMDIDTYHSQKACDGPSVSSTGLKSILHGCPKKFFATSDLNPKQIIIPKTKALNFGSAAHCLVLGEPEFNKKFIISPFENFTTKEARIWRDSQTRTIVKVDDMVTIQAMTAAQKASQDVTRAFSEGEPERTLIWKDEETGLWLKARPDWLPYKPEKRLTTEYKTAESIAPRKLNRAVFDYHYEMQAAMVLDGIQATTDFVPVGLAHIVQEKDPPYLVGAYMFTPEQIDFGRMQNRKAIRILADCLSTGIWPSYTTGPTYFETPYWISKAMENFDDSPGHSDEASPYSAADYLGAG